MNNKTGKVIWFTFKQVVTSNWFCLISVLGLVCVFLSTQIDKIIGAIYGTTANISGQGSVTLSEHDATFLLQISIHFHILLPKFCSLLMHIPVPKALTKIQLKNSLLFLDHTIPRDRKEQ